MPRVHWVSTIAYTLLLAGAPAFAQSYIVTTIAGGSPPASGIPATRAAVGDPPRVAVDTQGNVYFASLACVFRVTPSGVLTRVAGTARTGYAGDGGSALDAQLVSPDGVAVDRAGNVYVSDPGVNVVRRIATDGTISTYAGNGTAGFSGDGGPATNAQLNNPAGLATDTAGNLYIADSTNQRIRAVSPDGHIATVAGSGSQGYSGDSGDARAAALDTPEGVAVDAPGNLYIADTQNYRVRVVSPNGTINTVAGVGNGNVFGDGGPATAAGLELPTAVAVGAAGNLYIADYGNSRIRMVSGAGVITTVVGSDKGAPLEDSQTAISVRLTGPTGLAVDLAGNLYFTEGSVGTGTGLGRGDYHVWKVANGVISALAGTGADSYSGDGNSAITAQFEQPSGVALDASGNLYIADTKNHRVRKVSPAGIVTTVAGTGVAGFSNDGGAATSAELNEPTGLAVDSYGNLWIADTGNSRIRMVFPSGTIYTFVGNGNASYYGDGGPDFQASLNHPQGVAVDSAGSVYVADTFNNAIRKRASDGTMSTIAGTGAPGFAGDGGPAARALLNGPTGVAVDGSGLVYIVDAGNSRLRRIGLNGTITTVASGLVNPRVVTVDAAGNVYLGSEHSVSTASATSQLAVIAGTSGCCYTGDGGGALSAALDEPAGIAVDSSGDLYVADSAENAVRELIPASSVPKLLSVVNGASNISGPIAAGEVVVLYGSGLGPAQLTLGASGTSVLFNGNPGTVLYSSAAQTSAVAPPNLSGSTVQVSVEYRDLAAAPVSVALAGAAPGIFTADGSGQGQAAALNADGSANSAAHPATGSITLFATGVSGPVQVTIGGVAASDVSQSETSGVFQVSVALSSGLKAGAVPVLVQSGGVASQTGVTISVGP